MRTLTRLAAAVAVAALVAGCSGPAAGATAATVSGTAIPRDLLASEVRLLVTEVLEGSAQERGRVVGTAQRDVLTLLIQAEVIHQLADERGVTVDEAEVASVTAAQVEASGGEELLESQLLANQLTLALFRDVLVPAQVRLDAIREDLADSLPTRTVRHILVETEEEAEALVDDLAGGADFGALAEEHSLDPQSAARGGDLGAAPQGTYVDAFDDAAWGADLDTVVGPVTTSFGVHVLEVTAEGPLGGAEIDPQLLGRILQEQVARLLEDAFRSADVQVDPGLGVWDPQQGGVVAPERVGEPRPEDELMPEVEDLADP